MANQLRSSKPASSLRPSPQFIAAAGVPQPQEDHALRAAAFALDIAAAAAGCPVDPDDESAGFVSVRVGLHSGPVIGTVVGNARNRPKYTLLGDTVRGRAALARLVRASLISAAAAR